MINIDVKINANPALNALKGLDSAANSFAKTIAKLNAVLAQTPGIAGAAAAALKNGTLPAAAPQRSPSQRSPAKPPLAYSGNPYVGMQAFAQMASMGQMASINKFMTYQRMYNQQQRGVKAAQGFQKGPQSILGKGASSIMGMVGMDAEAGPIGMVLAGLTVELGLFATVTKFATDALSSWTHQLVIGGGTPGQARAVGRIDEALGTNLAGTAKNAMSGYGPIAAALAGVNPFGGPFGDNDYNAKGLKYYDYERGLNRKFGGSAQGFNQARRFAELAGDPNLASAYLLSPETSNALRSQKAGQASMSNMRSQADFAANASLVVDSLKDIAVTVVGPVLRAAAPILVRFANALKQVPAPIIEQIAIGLAALNPVLLALGAALAVIKGGFWVFDEVRAFFKWLYEQLAKLHVPGFNDSTADDHGKKLDRNSDALDDLTGAVKEGTYGGGARARGAVGSGMNPLAPGWKPGQTSYGVL